MAVMIGIRSALWNHSASWPISVTCGWKPIAPVGWPTVASGAVRAALLDSTWALDGSSPAVTGGLIASGWAGAACELALIASAGARAAGAEAGAPWARAAAGASAKAAAARISLSGVFI